MRLNRLSNRTILVAVLTSFLLLTACGSDDEADADDTAADGAATSDTGDGDAAAETETESDAAADQPEADAESDEAGSSGGDAVIVVTAADGTVYTFTDVSSCDTSATNPDSLPITNGYDLFGRTEDGAFAFSAGRVGFDDETAFFAGSLEGDFDENGQNALMLYSFDGDGLSLVVDGGAVTGSVEAKSVGPPTRPHGDETTLTVEATC